MKVLLEVDVPENVGHPFDCREWKDKLADCIRYDIKSSRIIGTELRIPQMYSTLADILDGAKIVPEAPGKPMLDKETEEALRAIILRPHNVFDYRLYGWVLEHSTKYKEQKQELPENWWGEHIGGTEYTIFDTSTKMKARLDGVHKNWITNEPEFTVSILEELPPPKEYINEGRILLGRHWSFTKDKFLSRFRPVIEGE